MDLGMLFRICDWKGTHGEFSVWKCSISRSDDQNLYFVSTHYIILCKEKYLFILCLGTFLYVYI